MSGPDARVLLELAQCLCDDLAAWFPFLSGGLAKDKEYLAQRFESEGLTFLTKVLPKLGKSLDSWMRDESASWEYTPGSFNRQFLSGVRALITREGISANDRAAVLGWVRQLSYLTYKLELPFSEGQLQTAFDSFEARNSELEVSDGKITFYQVGEAARLCGKVLEGFRAHPLLPKHGPGAVATGEVGEEKWTFSRLYTEAHRVFPWYDYFVPTPRVWTQDPMYALKWYKSLERLTHSEARLIAVPKDSRGPRLISEEPLEIQYLQQGLRESLVSHLERASPHTRGFVNFERQDINSSLALQSSKTGEYATIDLSDASDRVSDFLVYLLFPDSVYRSLRAVRSHYTILPCGRKVRLNMHAPMGSATCFPVMALVCWCLCKSALRNVATIGNRNVYIYGDDIIVPVDGYEAVCEGLEAFGLRVNRDKSYHTGLFRESCGVDAWNGYNITPFRLKQAPPSHRNDVSGLANWVAVHNGLVAKGYTLTPQRMSTVVEKVVGIPWNIPGVPLSFVDDTLAPSSVRALNKGFKQRWNPTSCQHEIRMSVVRQAPSISKLAGWRRLHRNLLVMPRNPDRWQRRNAVSLKTAWVRSQVPLSGG